MLNQHAPIREGQEWSQREDHELDCTNPEINWDLDNKFLCSHNTIQFTSDQK